SPGMDGSRSDGLLAATWASMIVNGREGYRRYAEQIFTTSAAMQDAVRSHPELRLLGEPTFLFAFTSDEFDIYHVNDEMKRRGWRFNGLQYPNAIHMAVTRPQTQPGVVEDFASDLVEAVAYAQEHADEQPESSAVYGGPPVGPGRGWLDTRRAGYSREATGGPVEGYAPGALALCVGHTAAIAAAFGGDPVSHMLMVARDQPEVAAAARWYLAPVDYLT